MRTDTITAAYWKRIAAFFIDWLVFALYLAALGILSLAGLQDGLEQVFPGLFQNPIAFDSLAFITVILPFTICSALLEHSSWQGTPGKRILKIRVVTMTGGKLSFSQSLLRSGLKFLPWQLAHTAVFQILLGPASLQALFLGLSILAQCLVAANVIAALLNKRHQSFYDRISSTWVIKNRAEN